MRPPWPLDYATPGWPWAACSARRWLVWFTDAFTAACRASARLVDEALVRARFWADHREAALNERQRKVVNRMLEAGPGGFEGGLTQRKYVGMTGTSPATAARDIAALVKSGLLVPGVGAGRSAHYNLAIDGWEWKRPQQRAAF